MSKLRGWTQDSLALALPFTGSKGAQVGRWTGGQEVQPTAGALKKRPHEISD